MAAVSEIFRLLEIEAAVALYQTGSTSDFNALKVSAYTEII